MLRSLAAPSALALAVLAGSTSAAQAGTSPDWVVVPSPAVSGALSGVTALSATNAWAVGYRSSGGGAVPLTEHWNGSKWAIVKSPAAGYTSTLTAVAASSANSIWAVGYYSSTAEPAGQALIEHWNGHKWEVVPSPAGVASLSAVAAVPGTGQAWAVGDAEGDIVHWDGTSWSIAAQLTYDGTTVTLAGITAVSADDAWAVGDRPTTSYPATYPVAAHWNGSAWTLVSTPDVGFAQLQAVAGPVADNVWAVGGGNGPSPGSLTEHWDGSAWSAVPSPSPGTYSNTLYGVAVPSPALAWAVGITSNGNPLTSNRTLIEQWNGSAWALVASPNVGPADGLAAVAAVTGTSQAWAVGAAETNVTNPASQPLIEETG